MDFSHDRVLQIYLYFPDERRYYGQNVVYDNSLAGFPLNYHNYQQDYGNNYNAGYKGASNYKQQYRSASYVAPKSYGSPYSSVEYGAYLTKPANSYYSQQYGYKK